MIGVTGWVASMAWSQVREPYTAVAQATRQLSNLHATVTLLRNVLQRLRLIQRLHAMFEAPPTASPGPAGGCSKFRKQGTLQCLHLGIGLGAIICSSKVMVGRLRMSKCTRCDP